MNVLNDYKFFRFSTMKFLNIAPWEEAGGDEKHFRKNNYATPEYAFYKVDFTGHSYNVRALATPELKLDSRLLEESPKSKLFVFNQPLLKFFKLIFNFKVEFFFQIDKSPEIKMFFIKVLFFFKKHFYKLPTKKFRALVKLITLGSFGLNLDRFQSFFSKFIVLAPRKKHKHIFQIFRSSPTCGTRKLPGRVTILKGKTSWKALSRKKRIKKTRGISSITKFLYLTTFFSSNGRTSTGVVNLSVNLFF